MHPFFFLAKITIPSRKGEQAEEWTLFRDSMMVDGGQVVGGVLDGEFCEQVTR